MHNKLKFTEKHLSLVIGIPIILIGLSFFILLVKYAMESDLSVPAFYAKNTKVFYEALINIATGILQFAIGASMVIFSLIKISNVWKW